MKKLFPILLLLCCSRLIAQDITKIEYALDSDYGVGMNTVITVAAGENISPTFPVTVPANTPLGYHKVYLRVKNTNGWSQTLRFGIEIIRPTVINNAITGEYFIDRDPSFGLATPFSIAPESTNITQNILALLPSNLSVGFHKIYGRVKDSDGNWSQTFRINIEAIPDNNTLNVVAAEFFFIPDPEFGNAAPIAVVAVNPNDYGTWTFNVPYPVGNYNFNDKLFLRVKDVNGNWSHTRILNETDPLLSNHASVKTDSKINIYPNPTADFVNILNTENKKLQVVLIDQLGNKVFESLINTNEKINLSSYQTGIYFIQINDANNNKETFKVIKK